jgi:tetratricopeptide (TPR) repeat protein
VDAPAGTIVFIADPAVKRVAVSEREGTTVLAVGARPGEPFSPSAWEWFFEAYPLADSGQLDEALSVMREGLDQYPDSPVILYHLACIEARAGRADDARRHLARAIELRPELAERARDDADLEGIA